MAELKEDMLVSKDKVKVKRTTEEYELAKTDLVPDQGDEAPTWYNKLAGLLDKFRVIPRLVMLAYIFAFYKSVTWFMGLEDPTNSQAMYISTIVGAGAALWLPHKHGTVFVEVFTRPNLLIRAVHRSRMLN